MERDAGRVTAERLDRISVSYWLTESGPTLELHNADKLLYMEPHRVPGASAYSSSGSESGSTDGLWYKRLSKTTLCVTIASHSVLSASVKL